MYLSCDLTSLLCLNVSDKTQTTYHSSLTSFILKPFLCTWIDNHQLYNCTVFISVSDSSKIIKHRPRKTRVTDESKMSRRVTTFLENLESPGFWHVREMSWILAKGCLFLVACLCPYSHSSIQLVAAWYKYDYTGRIDANCEGNVREFHVITCFYGSCDRSMVLLWHVFMARVTEAWCWADQHWHCEYGQVHNELLLWHYTQRLGLERSLL